MNSNLPSVAKPDILLVDDNPKNLRLLQMMLNDAGYKVRTILNGKLALRAVEIVKPDLILLDINMPGMDGYEVCQKLKSQEQTVDMKNNLTESEVEAMINQISQKVLPINLKEVTRLGIDEISLVKGQGKFIVVLVDLDTGQLIALIKERKSEMIEAFLKSWSQEILEQIKEVSMYLLKMYKTVFNKLCPNAVITADRFHVTKLLHQELNQGRIDQKKTANDLAIKAREKIFSTLKGGKYVLLKREKELKEKLTG